MKSFLEYRKEKDTIIDEALLPKEEHDAERMMGNGHSHYRNKFLDHNPKAKEAFRDAPDTKQWSHRVPVSLTEHSAAPHEAVTSFLRANKYDVTPESYKDGIAHKTSMVGDESRGIPLKEKTVPHKIGGLLEKHGASEETKKNYTNDTFRNGAKTKDFDIVLSGHPHDVYGGSTGRGWISCANKRKDADDKFKGKGPAAEKMDSEINNHTHNAYLVPRGGNVDTDAVGRMSFKHHSGLTTGHETLLPEERVYGTPPTAFAHAAKKVVSDLFDKKPGEIYKKNEHVYNDNGNNFSFPEGKMKPEHVDAAWKSIGKKDESAKHQLYAKVDPSEKYKSTELNSVAKQIKSIGDAAKSGDFNEVSTAVSHASSQISSQGHYHLVGQNEHMDAALDAGVKTFDVKNPEHVNELKQLHRNRLHINSTFTNRIARSIPHAKTVDDYHHISELKDQGLSIGTESYRVPIDKKHSMGKNPHEAIVKSLSEKGTLTQKSYSQSWLSTAQHQKHSGNVFDSMVAHENSGVPGMSKVVDDAAENMSKSNLSNSYSRYSHADNQAASYHRMKPETRARISSVLGEDHVKIMRNNRTAINDDKEIKEKFKAAKIKKELEA